MPPKNASTHNSRLNDYEATDHLASGFNPDTFNSGPPLADFETDDESGANQADAAEDEGKAKGDTPKTPTATSLPNFKGTPLKQGGSASTAVSDGFSSLTRQDIAPALKMDVRDNEQVDFRDFLEDSLREVCTSATEHVNLVDRCLAAVLPICNAPETKKLLNKYCAPISNEVQRYAPKINAFNHILRELENLDVQSTGCQFQKPTDVMFHRNDPKFMKAQHNGMDTSRKPDVILARKQDMIDSQGGRDLDPENAPLDAFDWHIPMLTEEYKRVKNELDIPPPSYSMKLSRYIPAATDVEKTPSKRAVTDPRANPPIQLKVFLREDEDVEDQPIEQAPNLRPSSRSATTGGSSTTSVTSGSKRSRSTTNDSASKRRKNESGAEGTPPPIVQNAFYAAEMLNRGVYALHSYNILIVDDVAWIWFFDREGIIQTTGINFIQDLPYYVALLFAFQRFSERNWGIEPSLRNSQRQPASFELEFPESSALPATTISIDPTQKLYEQFCLNGRATRVLLAFTKSPCFLGNVKLSSRQLIAKIYWPEEDRINEATAIELAHSRLKDSDLKKHLPTLVGSMDFPYSTGRVRKALKIEGKEGGTKSRVPRAIIAFHHEQMSSLRDGEHLLSGWRGCFECHYALWKGGIEHGDISLRNLMWDPFLKVGILNDFDLIHIFGEDSKGGRRTGTIAFMALRLINPLVMNPRRFYRDDVESLIWVLIWICLYYGGPDDIPQGMEEGDVQKRISLLQEWKTGDAHRAFQVRTAFFYLLNSLVPCNAFKELWILTKKLGKWVKRLNDDETIEGLDCTEEVEVIHKQVVDIIKEYESRD